MVWLSLEFSRRFSLVLCLIVCVCFPGGHDVQFRSLLDGSDLHSHHLSGVWCGLQSVSWDSSVPAIKPWTSLSLWSPEVCVIYTVLKVLTYNLNCLLHSNNYFLTWFNHGQWFHRVESNYLDTNEYIYLDISIFSWVYSVHFSSLNIKY